jgi:hypothetical protein
MPTIANTQPAGFENQILLTLRLEYQLPGDPNVKYTEAIVPGSVQTDIARAENYGDYKYAENWKDYLWMEDQYFSGHYVSSSSSHVLIVREDKAPLNGICLRILNSFLDSQA